MSKSQQKTLMNAGVFLVILFVGLTLGGWLSAFLLPYMGVQGTLVGSGISFVITGSVAYILIKKFGKKSVQ